MKKVVLLIISLGIYLSLTPIEANSYLSQNYRDEKVENYIENEISQFGENRPEIESLTPLYDVNNNESYILAEFEDQGYAIVTKENQVISEYSMEVPSPYEQLNGKYKFYLGANNYEARDSLYAARTTMTYNPEIVRANELMLNATNDDTLQSRSVRSIGWSGVDEDKMLRYNWGHYSPYVDGTNGICGTVVSTILLSYYDDWFDNRLVPDVLRPQMDYYPGLLYEVMWYGIDMEHPNGTMPWDIVTAINSYFNTYNPAYNGSNQHTYRAAYDTAPTFQPCARRFDEGKIVCMGLLKALGSSYGDHWVAAYAYGGDSSGTYYKCIDTWVGGKNEVNNYKKTININWTSAFVYIDPIA